MNEQVTTIHPLVSRIARAGPESSDPEKIPQPSFTATCVLLAGLFLTSVALYGNTASAVARSAAIGCGLSLGLSLFFEAKKGTTNLLRADLVAMFALYFLLFFEFLFPQRTFDDLVPYPQAIISAIRVSLWAFAGIAIGRHFISRHLARWKFARVDLPPGAMLTFFGISFALGYFHMLMSVGFNPITMVQEFMGPRFEVPWGREKFGDFRALFYELGAILYLVPPLAGVILGRRKHYTPLAVLLVLLGFLFTLFYGFCTGTRNIIASYLITFLAAYIYSSSASRRQMIAITAVVFGILFLATYYEIRFRAVGLRNYLQGMESGPGDDEEQMGLYVDYNLYNIGALVSIFPDQADYIGWDAPLWLIARPIPRAFWPGKPDGSAVSIENVFGVEGVTIAATFVGESYIAAGLFGVIIVALLIGMLAQWWTRKAFSPESGFGILIYGSGFFAVVISMRSIYWLPVAILPTLAAIVLGYFLRGPSGSARTLLTQRAQ
jgi:oligosaccharide repeat unit polymerase